MAFLNAALLLTLLLSPLRLLADSASSKHRMVTKLAEGVYEIRHQDAPDHFSQGNTAVIVGDTGVLVVDSCYLPSSAREDITQIRQWTNKPVGYLLNTHWHNDHIQGNAAYAEAFPGITIVAQTETAMLMALRVGSYLSEYPHRMERFQQELESGKDPSGRPLTEEEKEDLKNAVAGGRAASEAVSAEFQGLKVKVPAIAFDHELDLDLGNREVQLKYLGRGNTVGDAVAYLPKQKILIAGDLVDSPVPYLYGGFPMSRSPRSKEWMNLTSKRSFPPWQRAQRENICATGDRAYRSSGWSYEPLVTIDNSRSASHHLAQLRRKPRHRHTRSRKDILSAVHFQHPPLLTTVA